jgi:hypothetical protein
MTFSGIQISLGYREVWRVACTIWMGFSRIYVVTALAVPH